MLVQASQGQSGSAHVVVLGNEKGGSGKSTTALHIAVALLKAGQRVATIDLDCRQQSFTHYINNRSAWARRTKLDLELPLHRCIKLGETMQVAENENSEFLQFMEAVSAQVPLRRAGQPEDVAGTIGYLCSEDASYVSGQVIYVAGGPRT
jgi:chromosome partitioning protein